ncbi:MAG: MBL fold metallo-hydrolase [Kouleothrix sp.]|nr:MBL fold metallo-hydrolase [Kouleothrix sp.]
MSHQLNQISPHVYWLTPDSTTDRPILGAVSGAHGSLIVDAGNSPAHARLLLRELDAAGAAPPAFLMLTHWHWDHVFGTAALPIPALAHDETRRIVAKMARLDWSDEALDRRVDEGVEIAFCRDMIKAELPDRSELTIRPPEIGFSSQVELDLGGVTCRIVHVGGDHAHDSSVVYVPEERIVFLGDCIYDDLYHGPRRVTTNTLLPLLDRLLGYDAAYYLAAHHAQPLSRAQLADEAALLGTIGRTVEQVGRDRAAILARLPGALGADLTEEHVEIADAFLAGLALPVVQSVM